MSGSKISLDEVTRGLTDLQDTITGKVQDKRQTLVTAAAAGGLILLLLFFLLGRRSGKKKTSFVEIRRI